MLTDRRMMMSTVGMLGFAPVLWAQETSPFIEYPSPIPDVGQKTQKPICSIAEAIAAYARASAENIDFLTLARTQCDEALKRLDEIISSESLSGEPIQSFRYIEGISELIEQSVSVETIGEYAKLMHYVVGESKDIIDMIINDPKSVEDDAVVKLFKNFAAINLLNAGMFGMPAG